VVILTVTDIPRLTFRYLGILERLNSAVKREFSRLLLPAIVFFSLSGFI
jgi:hypothetical protein